MTIEDMAKAVFVATIDPAWPDYRTAPPTWEREGQRDMNRWRCERAARAVVLALADDIESACKAWGKGYEFADRLCALTAEARQGPS